MLTIISVSYYGKDFLELNYDLLKALNPCFEFEWIVAQNTPTKDLRSDLDHTDKRFKVVPGAVLTDLEKETQAHGSIHHAKAIEIALSYTDSDRVLILDPDCFVFRKNWLEDCLQHMDDNGLVFLGTPYHPSQNDCYRNFPNVICMFIHRGRLQKQGFFELDFSPCADREYLDEMASYYAHPKRIMEFLNPRKRHPKINLKDWKRICRMIVEKFFQRLGIGLTQDTGYKLFEAYHKVVLHEELQIFGLDTRSFWAKGLERFLPDFLRKYPRRSTYVTHKYCDDFLGYGRGGNQYFWKGEFFAIHLNGTSLHFYTKKHFEEALKEKVRQYLLDYRETGILQKLDAQTFNVSPKLPI